MLPMRRLGDMHSSGLRKLKLTTSQLATAVSGRTLCEVSLGGPSPLQHAAAAFTAEVPKSFDHQVDLLAQFVRLQSGGTLTAEQASFVESSIGGCRTAAGIM